MNALQSLHNGSLTGKREQTVLSPAKILKPLRSVWDRIQLDPCAAPVGPVWVPCTVKGCKNEPPGRTACRHCHGAGGVLAYDQVRAQIPIRKSEGGDGLAAPWCDRTYYNPPYDVLKPWLAVDRIPNGARAAGLVPVRSHRTWWREWARRQDVVIYLNPFRFEGHSSTYPAPMCLGYKGHDHKEIVEAFAGLGGVL